LDEISICKRAGRFKNKFSGIDVNPFALKSIKINERFQNKSSGIVANPFPLKLIEINFERPRKIL
jgi:hypothetical protein